MATLLGSLLVSLGLESAQFRKGMSEAERTMKLAQQKFDRIGTRMANVGKTMSLAVTAPVVAFGVAAGKAAIDAEEMQSAFDVVFGKSANSVREWAEATGDAMGRSTQEIQRGALAFQELFGKALDPAKSVEMSKSFAVLTQDLASFKNLSNEVAQQKLFSGLSGEAEPLREVGVFLSAAKVEAKGLALGLETVNGKLTEEAKIVARAAVIQEELSAAQGDVARTSASTANQIKASQAAWEELSVIIGSKLLPAITPVITKIADAINWFSRLNPTLQNTIVVVAGVGAALGPIIYVVGNLTSAFGILLPVLAKMGPAFAAVKVAAVGLMANPVILGFAAVLAGIYLAWQNWDEIGPMLKPLTQELTALGEGLGLVEMRAGATRAELERDSGWRTVGEGLRDFNSRAQSVADGIDEFLAKWTKFWRVDLPNAVQQGGAAAKKYVADMVSSIGRWMGSRLNAIWDGAKKKIADIKGAFFNLYDAVVGNSYIPDMVVEIGQHMSKLDRLMVDPAMRATAGTKEAFRNLAAEVSTILDRLFPQAARLKQLRSDLASIDQAQAGGLLPEDAANEARFRLNREYRGNDQPYELPENFAQPLVDLNAVEQNIDRMSEIIANGMEKAKGAFAGFKEFGARAFESLAYQLEGFLLGAQSAMDAIRNLARELASMALRKFVMAPLGAALGIPGFAKGTNFAPGGMALVGERGPELVNLPRGSQVIPNHKMGQMMGGGNTVNLYMTPTGNPAYDRENASMAARKLRQTLNG